MSLASWALEQWARQAQLKDRGMTPELRAASAGSKPSGHTGTPYQACWGVGAGKDAPTPCLQSPYMGTLEDQTPAASPQGRAPRAQVMPALAPLCHWPYSGNENSCLPHRSGGLGYSCKGSTSSQR